MSTNAFIRTLNLAINRYLALDPESKQRLHKLDGERITIELLPFHFVFQCHFHANKIEVLLGEAEPTETKITGTPLQMLNVMLQKDKRQQFFKEDVMLEGNAELGQEVIHLFDHLHIDWEENLSHLIGDIPAYHTQQFFNKIKSWVSRADKTATDNINEYLHEEAECFPTRESLNNFFHDIDTLRMDVDRMEALINHHINNHKDAS